MQWPLGRLGGGWPTVELLPHLALGGLELNLPAEVAGHLPMVGESCVDRKLCLCGLQTKGNAAFTWEEERQHQHENLGLGQAWSMLGDVAVALGDSSLKQLTRQVLRTNPFDQCLCNLGQMFQASYEKEAYTDQCGKQN